MQFSAADIDAMIEAMGTDIDIYGQPFRGVFTAPGKVFDQFSGQLITTAPSLMVSIATAENITEHDTLIGIDGIDYQAISKTGDGAGFVEIDLTKDF